jgi:hypothetical protein
MTTTPDPIELHAAEIRLCERRLAALAALATADKELASSVVSAELGEGEPRSVPRGRTKLGELRAEVESLDAAINDARLRRVAAIKSAWATSAVELREEARTLRAEADGVEVRVREALQVAEEIA